MGFAILVAILAEITSVVMVAEWLGGLFTLALLALAGGVGLAVLAGRGVATLTRAGQAMNRGEAVGAVVADGALLAFAGVLLLVPGFLSDAAALVLIIPPLRALVARWLVDRVQASVVQLGGVNVARGPDVIDTTATEVPPPPRPELP